MNHPKRSKDPRRHRPLSQEGHRESAPVQSQESFKEAPKERRKQRRRRRATQNLTLNRESQDSWMHSCQHMRSKGVDILRPRELSSSRASPQSKQMRHVSNHGVLKLEPSPRMPKLLLRLMELQFPTGGFSQRSRTSISSSPMSRRMPNSARVDLL